MEKFYITTPIYYPSDKLHIGHAYCTVATDAAARYKRMCGYDVMFLTGTDEHGQKIERRANETGKTPQQYVDDIVSGVISLWKLMDISYDDFLRTTQPRHQKIVQKIFKTLYDKGDIYKGEYEGLYCTPCESFWTERQLVDGKCPDCGREVEKTREESYFFRLSKYQDRIMQHIKDHPEFILPESRANEMINNFLKPGLEDLCVSRTSFTWGIPVEFDPKHIVYVWMDALTNYITALGYMSEDESKFNKYWPADVHVVGKEIVRFHTIIWPAFLMALDLPLPKQVFGHGWLNINGQRMAKSRGNVIDPVVLCNRYTSDAVRYYLLSELPFGSDGNFTTQTFLARVNSDLANDLGNLLSRSVSMAEKYFGSSIPAVRADLDDAALPFDETVAAYKAAMESMQFSEAIAAVKNLIARANKMIDITQPWVLAKDADKAPELAAVLYNLFEALRIVSVLYAPFMPKSAAEIRSQLGLDEKLELESAQFCVDTAYAPKKGRALFPRLDIEAELNELEKLVNAAVDKSEAAKTPEVSSEPEKLPEITIDDFSKCRLIAAKVIACEKVDKSDKLLKFRLFDGDGERQVLSGIAKFYEPNELIGKTVALVANLKPVKLRGELSSGMLLSTENASDNRIKIIILGDDVPAGSVIR